MITEIKAVVKEMNETRVSCIMMLKKAASLLVNITVLLWGHVELESFLSLKTSTDVQGKS